MSEAREYITRTEENGDIHISEDVLTMIAGAAALEVEGIAGLMGNNFGDQLLGKKNFNRGVGILREDEALIINISIVIKYGFAVPELARKVQEAIVASVEATSGLTVKAVNIRVGSVVFEKGGK